MATGLRLEQEAESPGGLVRAQVAPDWAFLTGFQMSLMLLPRGPTSRLRNELVATKETGQERIR